MRCDAFGFGSAASALEWWPEPGTTRPLDQTLISHLHTRGSGEDEKMRESSKCEIVRMRKAEAWRPLGGLTRVRVARQAAVSAGQCCLGSCERDAVIILEGGQSSFLLQATKYRGVEPDSRRAADAKLTSGILVCSICRSS